MNTEAADRRRDVMEPSSRVLETIIGGTTEIPVIERATAQFTEGLVVFVSPSVLDRDPDLHPLSRLASVVRERIESVGPLITDVVSSINRRAEVVGSSEYRALTQDETRQWRSESEPELPFGVRGCVDAGIPRESIVGSEGHFGRSLAGDDELDFVPARSGFRLAPSSFHKRMIHAARTGTRGMLEALVEHTGCGRRGQMIANIGSDNEVARLYEIVFANLEGLFPEFAEDHVQVTRGLERIRTAWASGKMVQDGGVWAGILVKIAQRQAYRNIGHNLTPIVPIELYDKSNANVLAGLDSISALTHRQVLHEGGFTAAALDTLVSEGIAFSLKHELIGLSEALAELPVSRGQRTFEDLQREWLPTKRDFVSVSGKLWEIYRDPDRKYDGLRSMVDRFLRIGLGQVSRDLVQVDQAKTTNEVTSDLIKRRLTHQLFRALAYSWVLDTFEKGHPPGKHMEDHLATGESAVLGVKEHLPLGQGDMQPPTATEFFTGRAVLLHSKPGHEGKPIVVIMKHDTDRPDEQPLSTEETQRAMDDFAELLKLWPYVAVGDIVPVVLVRGKGHGGASRLALSVVSSFGDLVSLNARQGRLPELVPANTSSGEVVMVPAGVILQAGVEAGTDLRRFRELTSVVADHFADPVVQKRFK